MFFYFENLIYKCFFFLMNLIYKWIKQFEKLQESNPMEVRVAFLPECPLILSLLKLRGVGGFLN